MSGGAREPAGFSHAVGFSQDPPSGSSGKLGRVALDGSKVRANASKHKAVSYGRMKAEQE